MIFNFTLSRTPIAHRNRASSFVLLGLATLLAGCSVNPATGESNFTAFMSPEDELRVGREQHPKILKEFGGAYDHAKANAYVNAVGQKLARQSDLPNLKYTFTVLDSDVINAFALPGGYIYISRGLLALANTEAELAGVLAHEIGHVTARHSAQRYSSSVVAGLGTALLGVVAGGTAAQLGQQGAAVYLQGYSRNQEFEADTLGVRYLARTGYETGSMASFLASLKAYSELEAKTSGLPDPASRYNILSTHPRTGDRVVAATKAAQAVEVANPRIGNIAHLNAIDGIVFGDSDGQGFVRGRVFAHKILGFRFEVPDGFQLANGTRQVVARGPSDAVILFNADTKPFRGRMTSYLTDAWAPSAKLTGVQSLNVNGMDAAAGATRLTRQGSSVDLQLVAIRFSEKQIYRFMFASPPAMTEKLNVPYRRTTFSFRRLSEQEKANLRPWRVITPAAAPGKSVGQLSRGYPLPGSKEEWFRVLNGLAPNSQPFAK
ncbi:MAG: M48 family metalloprotease, partial [Alphaproteobacteria bacterium]|nr:M48 family metalloprotease [Alphaproteobacteria bacterium]